MSLVLDYYYGCEEPTRKMVKEFKAAGWTALRTDGSHTMYGCRSGRHRFVLPDGHGTISPGAVRNARKSIAECDCSAGRKEEERSPIPTKPPSSGRIAGG